MEGVDLAFVVAVLGGRPVRAQGPREAAGVVEERVLGADRQEERRERAVRVLAALEPGERIGEVDRGAVLRAPEVAALDLLESDADFDVVLCDLMMPRMSGMDLERELRLRHAELADRMVFISGGAFSDGAASFLEETEQPVLEKPFDGASLREIVADVARRV